MSQPTQEKPYAPGSSFAGRVFPDEDSGLRHLEVDVKGAFQTDEELIEWLYACVDRLAAELEEHKNAVS